MAKILFSSNPKILTRCLILSPNLDPILNITTETTLSCLQICIIKQLTLDLALDFSSLSALEKMHTFPYTPHPFPCCSQVNRFLHLKIKFMKNNPEQLNNYLQGVSVITESFLASFTVDSSTLLSSLTSSD